jgi:thiosulfate/3-mercaptopyruvate sulfurtransferase
MITMKMLKTIRWMATLTLVLPVLARAADEPARKPEAPPLLSHDELQKRLSDPRLRVLDVRSREKYEKGHIPGAIWVDLRAFQALTKPEALADKDAWGRVLAPLAIGGDLEAYIYDDDRQHIAGRLWWLLSYAGAPHVGLIDGGFPLWERDHRPVSSEVVRVEPRDFAVSFHARRLASRDEVRSAIGDSKFVIVDARTEAEYRGQNKPQSGRRAGHIPSARLLDLYSLVDADGRFLSVDAQRAQLAKAGITPDRTVIAYSNSGNRSGGIVFALRRLGIPARHYIAGFSVWASDPAAPVEQGNGAARRTE